MLTCWWRYSLKFSLYSQYLSSRCQLMPFLTHYHILLFFRIFWQGKLPPHNLVNWLGSQGRDFLCKSCRIFDSTGNHKTNNAFHEWKLQKKNKSNYKQTQIINHHWSISAFLELQESQTYCSRAPNNKLSQLFKQYHFSLQSLSSDRFWLPYSICTFVISGVM